MRGWSPSARGLQALLLIPLTGVPAVLKDLPCWLLTPLQGQLCLWSPCLFCCYRSGLSL